MSTFIFKSSYLLRVIEGDWNPFTPNVIEISESKIEARRRNWYLISTDKQNYHFQNISGVELNKNLFGAVVKIYTNGGGKIVMHGFSKSKANEILSICEKHINNHSQKSVSDTISNAVAAAMRTGKASSGASISDEIRQLKALLDDEIITKDEFEYKKNELLFNQN